MMLHDLLVEVSHALPLPAQTLPRSFGDRERFFQDVVAPLGPHPASRRITLWSIRKQWLHFLLGISKIHNSPENITVLSCIDSQVTGIAHTHAYMHRSCTGGCTEIAEGIGIAVLRHHRQAGVWCDT